MAKAKTGDTVRVHYTGQLKDGTVFDSSVEREPLEFTLGENMVVEGFEQGVEGMEPGELRKVTIEPEKGYGFHNPELTVEVRREQIPPEIELEVGLMLEVPLEDGSVQRVVVSELDGESVTLDGNHPLAGKTMIFDLNLVEIA
ncbi:MAG: peptidylprolyl isomerase [Proteobacteria bacterium]|nr:peptidylprolyl isomerase [Pseudomonadota bacterium]MBU1610780.1 peptidylprolyl isomerase [Pseudomonadota bacterium]